MLWCLPVRLPRLFTSRRSCVFPSSVTLFLTLLPGGHTLAGFLGLASFSLRFRLAVCHDASLRLFPHLRIHSVVFFDQPPFMGFFELPKSLRFLAEG